MKLGIQHLQRLVRFELGKRRVLVPPERFSRRFGESVQGVTHERVYGTVRSLFNLLLTGALKRRFRHLARDRLDKADNLALAVHARFLRIVDDRRLDRSVHLERDIFTSTGDRHPSRRVQRRHLRRADTVDRIVRLGRVQVEARQPWGSLLLRGSRSRGRRRRTTRDKRHCQNRNRYEYYTLFHLETSSISLITSQVYRSTRVFSTSPEKKLQLCRVYRYYFFVAQFDGLALIDAVTDLAELLGRRSTIDDFLRDLVDTVANHLGAEVCSVYLYDVEQDLLVLRATRGLNPDLVGRVRLGPGEGLTGHAFLHNRPVLERNARDSRLNKTIPDLGEENYPSFLGVPIKRGKLGIGVLTLQYTDGSAVDEHALRTLRALASHLAATLESAAALYESHEAPVTVTAPLLDRFESGLLHGTSASRGIAIGFLEYLDERADGTNLPVRRNLRDAIDRSSWQLLELQRQVDETLSDVAMMIFSSHLLMLRDESFVGRMIELADAGADPREAVHTVTGEFSRRFGAIQDPRFQEKVQDVQDLGHRIVRNLVDQEEDEGDYRGSVVATRDVFPSELVKLHLQNVEGLVFAGGGATGHVALLAQSLGLPTVAIADPRLFTIPAGTRLVVDAEDGKLAVDPAPEILDAYRERVRPRSTRDDTEPVTPVQTPLYTTDGTEVTLLANVNLVKDARAARAIGADGVGLYRSEIPFLIRNGFPTEEEQVTVYRRIIDTMEGLPVTFRAMDLGGDKLLGSSIGREDNPFLGFRGVRFLLENREIFRDQLRAMLRAGSGADMSILFPMIATREEFLACREEVERSIRELEQQGYPEIRRPRLGVMVELPATVEIIEDLAPEAEFFSAGTNDLTMYMLAADRTNHRVANLYRAVHPGVLRTLNRLVRAARACDRPVSICGSDASDPTMVVFYLGIGVTRLSVDPGAIPDTASLIRSIDREEAGETARRMLAATTAQELQKIIRGFRCHRDKE